MTSIPGMPSLPGLPSIPGMSHIRHPAAGTNGRQNKSNNPYEVLDANAAGTLVGYLKQHGVLLWIIMPILVVVQVLVDGLKPTCKEGYSNVAAGAIAALLFVHHTFAEVKAWTAAKSLLTEPEVTVMGHLGVLRKRKMLFWLGVVEDLCLYANFLFLFVARSCNLQVTDHWAESWRKVPLIGKPIGFALLHLRFWGVSGIVVSCLLLIGLLALTRMLLRKIDAEEKDGGTSGETFLSIASYAEGSAMPCVSCLCEEMALQRRWKYNNPDLDQEEGAPMTHVLRKQAVLGKVPKEYVQMFEITDRESSELVERAERCHFLFIMLFKVLLANTVMMWAQATFFMLAFEKLGDENKYKLIAGMVMCAVTMFTRSVNACSKLGNLGLAIAACVFLVAAWAAAVVFHAFQCPEHVWTVTKGCMSFKD